METGRIGRRIAYWRERRGFTQGDFGRQMGKSRRWVQDLEGGQRQADPRLSVLERAAEILRVPLEQLLAEIPDASVPTETPADVRAVLDALDHHDILTGVFGPDREPPPPTAVRRSLDYCCNAFQACHYSAIGRQLPQLLIDAHRAAASAPAGAECAAHAVLSRVYQLTASFLHKFGTTTTAPAALAADRALAAAERSGDPVAIGAASRRVAKSLMYQQRPEAAVSFATRAAARLSADLGAAGPLGLSTLGMLYLNAAVAASARPRTPGSVIEASGHVDQAEEAAGRQGEDRNEDWTMFGPTNVRLHRIDVLVRFGDGWSAVEAAEGLDPAALAGLTRERRALHLLAMARASVLTRQREQATRALLEADAMAPEEVRGRPSGVHVVRDVVAVTPQPSRELRELAERCGLRA
ncbi:helix-turn-helix transcriptional regulator [Streptomyces albus subsp. chlorinus]|uniref:helix-turn-helix domain-containing protein n=1 Tax=Streptomyces albus TaxID=1888 RepID=UPI00156F5814|nr:helix-turn-helix transcriptional regulator [Streptomyces albus]NSC21456.1 helix-turn-helix transcriptional regulator [Streptomyces albus subsp. chlorinus]